MDANLATLLGLVVTSVTTIIIAVINMMKSRSIEKKVDAGNAATDSVHVAVNGNNAALQQRLADAQAEIARLNLEKMPPKE